MTVQLLGAWGNQPAGTTYTSDAATEAAMVAAGVATTNLVGSIVWNRPTAGPLPLSPGYRPGFRKRYTLGVSYFPGFSYYGGGDPGGSPANWNAIPDPRVPHLGRYDESAQSNVDYDLEVMTWGGIDYVTMEVYFQAGTGGTIVPYLDHALNRYLSSTVPNKPKLLLMLCPDTNAVLYTPASWPTICKQLVPFFRDQNYLQIKGKPGLIIFNVPAFQARMGGASGVATALNQLRAAASDLGGVHIIGESAAAGDYWAGQVLASTYDGVTAYNDATQKTVMYGDTTATSKSGFAQLDDALFGPREVIGGSTYHSWFGNAGYNGTQTIPGGSGTWAMPTSYPLPALQEDSWPARGIGHVLTPITTGWDKRPWDNATTLIAIPTPAEFEAHLMNARAAIDAHMSVTLGMANISAYNERGEGSVLEANNMYGFAYLAAVKRVFAR